MNIIFLGPPGAGKGTQAKVIVNEFNIPHISTGDAFRLAMSEGSELGTKAKAFVDQGLLVPDDITIGIVEARLQLDDCKEGFLLDGFPRTIEQAEALESILAAMGKKVDHVINISVDRSLLLARLTGRRICQSCGATYHVLFNAPKQPSVCDVCEGELIQRSDDTEEKVGTRLDEYATKTAPLLTYYKDKSVLRDIDGERDIKTVAEQLKALLRG